MAPALRIALYLVLTLAATAIALLGLLGGGALFTLGLSWEPPANLFTFLMTLVLLAVALLEYRGSPAARLPAALFLAVGLLFLAYFRQLPQDDYRDYQVYEAATKTLAAGGNPYATGRYYLYPPVFARAMTAAYTWLDPAWGTAADNQAQAQAASRIMHFLFQALQYCLLLCCWALGRAFLVRAGLRPAWAAIAVSALFLTCVPLFETLFWNQTNLMVLASLLAALVLFEKKPFLAGACLAAGIEIKLYPVVLLLPLLALRRFRAPAGAAAVLAAVFLIETRGLTDLTLWGQFLDHLRTFPYHLGLSNQGVNSFLYMTVSLAAGEEPARRLIHLLFPAFQLAVLAFFAWRFLRREKLGRASAEPEADRLLYHLTDMTALFLLVSPLTWQHQFVLALPLLGWAAVARGALHPRLLAGAFVSLNLAPLFFAFPFQYHRVAALLALLHITRPLPARTGGLQDRIDALVVHDH